MYLQVTTDSLTVEEPDDCRSLAVRVRSGAIARLADALAADGLGRPSDDDHVELVLDRLRERAAAGPVGPGWAERWDAMIAYATTKGWVSADGTTVRAHIEAC
jgi:hypothetical protein